MEIELEKTYLVKYLPTDLLKFPAKEYIDIYFPTLTVHPITRIRKRGHDYEITKKYAINKSDNSKSYEFTIPLTIAEFTELNSAITGKRSRKIRYFYDYQGIPSEIDIYQDDLNGLIIADFEFKDDKLLNSFKIPEFCLIEVTQDINLAGGMLVGKKYSDIEPILAKYGYKPLLSVNG